METIFDPGQGNTPAGTRMSFFRADAILDAITPALRADVARRILASTATEAIRLRPEWTASSLDSGNFLTEDACERYRTLFDKLSTLADDPDGVEPGAVTSARRVLAMMHFARWSPPQMTWHGGDAIVFFWTIGDTTHAITMVDGELGYLEQRGRMIVRRRDSVAIDGNCFSTFVP